MFPRHGQLPAGQPHARTTAAATHLDLLLRFRTGLIVHNREVDLLDDERLALVRAVRFLDEQRAAKGAMADFPQDAVLTGHGALAAA